MSTTTATNRKREAIVDNCEVLENEGLTALEHRKSGSYC